MSSNEVSSSNCIMSSAPLPKCLDHNESEQCTRKLIKGLPVNSNPPTATPYAPSPDLLLEFDQTRDAVQVHVQAGSSAYASSPSVHLSSSSLRISLPATANGNDCSIAPLELQFALRARVSSTSNCLVPHAPPSSGIGEAVFTLPKSEHEPWTAIEVPIVTLLIIQFC